VPSSFFFIQRLVCERINSTSAYRYFVPGFRQHTVFDLIELTRDFVRRLANRVGGGGEDSLLSSNAAPDATWSWTALAHRTA
jgi:hypothetical protein